MKKMVLFMMLSILISTNIYAKYPKEQMVLLRDETTGNSYIHEYTGKFAWVSETTTYNEEIFYYDGLQTYQITSDNNQGKKEILDFTNGEILYSDDWYDKYSNEIYSLYLYKNGNKIDLSNNNKFNGYAKRYEDRICWISGPSLSSSNNEIYLYQNNEIKKITDNTNSERYLSLNKDYLIWTDSGSSDVENRFFIYKDKNTTEFPVDILGYGFYLFDKGIVWRGCDGGEHCNETPSDLDHEIFFYDFDKITQITDTPKRIEENFKATSELIVWYSEGDDMNYKLSAYNFNDIAEVDVSNEFGGNGWPGLIINNNQAIFTDTIGGNKSLYLYDGSSFQIIDSGHNYDYGFSFGGVGYSYKDEQGNYATYLYKNGTKELIFDDINTSPYFLENYLVYSYAYPNTSVYKLVYLDLNLPYMQITGNETTKLQKGDTLKLSLTARNPGPDQAVDIYIVEISGEYPFQMFRFLNPEGFKYQLYGYKNVMLPKDLDLTFEFYSAKINDIPDAPLNKVSYMVIPTHTGTFIPLTAFPSTLEYKLVK